MYLIRIKEPFTHPDTLRISQLRIGLRQAIPVRWGTLPRVVKSIVHALITRRRV